MKCKKGLKILSILFAGVFCNGCVSHPSYPQGWNQLMEIRGCPSLTGLYMDKGERANVSEYKPSLYSYLISGDYEKKDEVQLIKIVQENYELLVEAYSGKSVLGKIIVSYNPSDCENGFLQIEVPNPEGGINREGVLAYEWGAYQLSKATDGALILRRDSSTVGMVLLIPAVGSQWSWYRFQPVGIEGPIIRR